VSFFERLEDGRARIGCAKPNDTKGVRDLLRDMSASR
jgi:hypothetical protein